MMPAWDEGAFCAPLTELLVALGYRVHIYDTLSLAIDCENLAAAAIVWDAVLRTRHPRIDLAVGQAYGGALVQYLLATALADCPRVIGLSAPTYTDSNLLAGLRALLHELETGSARSALRALDWWVHAANLPMPETTEPIVAPPATAQRLRAGLSHLCTNDARQQVTGFNGSFLWLYGEASRLVRGTNIIPALNRSGQRAIGIPSCGMRPLADARHLTLNLINQFLE